MLQAVADDQEQNPGDGVNAVAADDRGTETTMDVVAANGDDVEAAVDVVTAGGNDEAGAAGGAEAQHTAPPMGRGHRTKIKKTCGIC